MIIAQALSLSKGKNLTRKAHLISWLYTIDINVNDKKYNNTRNEERSMMFREHLMNKQWLTIGFVVIQNRSIEEIIVFGNNTISTDLYINVRYWKQSIKRRKCLVILKGKREQRVKWLH